MNLNRIFGAALLAALLCITGCAALTGNHTSADKNPPLKEKLPESGPPEAVQQPVSGAGGNHYFYFILSRLEAKAGRKEQAVRLLEKAVERAPDEPVLKRELARLYFEIDRKEDALAMAEELTAQGRDDVETLILVASIRSAAGQYRQAAQAYEKALAEKPGRKNIYLSLARLYLRNGDHKKAAGLMRTFVKRFPENHTGFYFLAEACAETGKFDEAVEAYEKSLELEPGFLEARIGLIEIYTEQGMDEKSAEQYEKLLERRPDNVAAAIELGLLYERLGEQEKAEDQWSRLSGRIESDQDAVLEIVRRLLARERHGDAVVVLSEMLKQAPDSPELNYFAGAARYMMKQFDAALEHFRVIGPAHELYRDAMIHRSIILKRLGRTEEALNVLEAAMGEVDEKDQVDLIPYLSAFYQQQGDYEKAEEILSKGISIEPENAELHYEMGILYDRMEDTEAALDKMRFVIEMDPENADALNYLGYSYADKDIRLDEAEAFIRRALDIEPENGYILDSMGWVYYRKGAYERALTYIERALEKVPDDPVILEHMGDVYLRLNNREKALEYYRKARENNGGEDGRPDLSEKIESLGNNMEIMP
ncbi:MAG: tetratricopeptide repeat protein [Desulfobacterales bacterium]